MQINADSLSFALSTNFIEMNNIFFLDLFKSLKMKVTHPCIPTKQKKDYLCLVSRYHFISSNFVLNDISRHSE